MLIIHPVAELFPEMTGAQFDSFVEDIRANGLREEILLHPDGSVIDGRNRYKACLAAGVEPVFRSWDGVGSLIDLVVSLNLHRRHLDESQRGMVGARVRSMFDADARERQATSTGGPEPQLRANLPEAGRARDKAAEIVNVSPRTVSSAAKIIQAGAPELVRAVDHGEVTVHAASQIADLPHEEQLETLAEGPKRVVERANEIRTAKKEAAAADAIASAPPNKRQQICENAEKQRMIKALSSLEALCGCLAGMNVAFIRKQCGDKELAEWGEIANEAGEKLHSFVMELTNGKGK